VTHMEVTREGKRFAVASSLIAVAALNTGNNLIYLILSLMFSILILSVVLARMNLSGLSLDVTGMPVVFAGEETSMTLLLRNDKSLVPSYSVKCRVSGSPAPAYYQVIPPLRGVENDLRITFLRRGLYQYGDFRISSGFPFILLNAERKIKVFGSVLVYPTLRDVGVIPEQIAGTEMAEVLGLAGVGDDVYSLREFREGDDWRRIHWKTSAKRGIYFVREYAEYRGVKVTIILDNRLPEGGELFEKAVSLAASLAKDFLERSYFVRVVSCKETVAFGSGEEHFFKILDFLAVIGEEDRWDYPTGDAPEGFAVTVQKTRGALHSEYDGAGGMVLYAEDL
jgi:uncharacterized protein (DUF58 family)